MKSESRWKTFRVEGTLHYTVAILDGMPSVLENKDKVSNT
jgi:hypothetical protein